MLSKHKLFLALALFAFLPTAEATAAPRYKAVAFDYFVLFNPDSVQAAVDKAAPGRGAELTRSWRAKLFEYGFLRSITGDHADFFAVAGDALDYAAAALRIELTPSQRTNLMNAYLRLDPWPDALPALQKLKAAGVKIITIANFSDAMLRANAENARITSYFDVLLSTATNATYKPDPKAYGLGMSTLRLKKEEILFAAFGGWDAYGAKKFGYPTFWVNRLSLPAERLGTSADGTSKDIGGLLDFILGP